MTKATIESIRKRLRQIGATQSAIRPVTELVFHLDFRSICESNTCGLYGKCWMCPPDVGEAEEMIAYAKTFDCMLVYQTIGYLEDGYDIDGMLKAGERHNQIAQAIQKLLLKHEDHPFLHLGAGGCRLCEICAKEKNQPCMYPNEALASLESYCIDVARLADSCGMKYTNGRNTVTYFGAVLFCQDRTKAESG